MAGMPGLLFLRNTMNQKTALLSGFDEMNLSPPVRSVLQGVGYETPTPIQSLTIPHMLSGKDMLGQARTGTGKTAAFALPLLSGLDLGNKQPQVLVLTPTRELAIQVAQSFEVYGAGLKGLSVLPVYGGQAYGVQLSRIRRGVHVVVGTPGRLMDHIRRKTLSFSHLSGVVLDEADEMLHMGFIDDVEWILDQTPRDAQTALFSATMPMPIRKIAKKYLDDPKEIIVKPGPREITTINQHFWMVKGVKKIHALARILSAASFDGVIVFTRTKTATLEVTKGLEESGFKAEALNGDMAQNARERTVSRLKNGTIDILVATDVAARGLDVDRISHVINYDMPTRVDPYIHRIGRTGRAGRTGEAVMFVGRKERWMVKIIERTTKQKIRQMNLPSNAAINKKRVEDFKKNITRTLDSGELDDFEKMIEAYALETGIPVARVAAALAKQSQGKSPFLLPIGKDKKIVKKAGALKSPGDTRVSPEKKRSAGKFKKEVSGTKKRLKPDAAQKTARKSLKKRAPQKEADMIRLKQGMDRYRIEVGRSHGLRPKDVVGAIANEAGLETRFIGSIAINRDYSFVDLPSGMPKEIFKHLKTSWVMSRQMAISKCA